MYWGNWLYSYYHYILEWFDFCRSIELHARQVFVSNSPHSFLLRLNKMKNICVSPRHLIMLWLKITDTLKYTYLHIFPWCIYLATSIVHLGYNLQIHWLFHLLKIIGHIKCLLRIYFLLKIWEMIKGIFRVSNIPA